MIQRALRAFSTNSLLRHSHFTEFEAKQLLLQPSPLRNAITQHLDMFGEIKVDQYWKIALTDPTHGYYAQRNVFAKEGDFVTSPEISPLFGELIGVWIFQFLQHTKILNLTTNAVEKKFRIIELGGGRGLLMRDILKTFGSLQLNDYFDLHFVEVSEYNRKSQQEAVLQEFKRQNQYFRFEHQKSSDNYESFQSQDEFKDINLRWFTSLEEILKRDLERSKQGQQIPFTVIIMNEYFDALPTSILKFTQKGWRQQVLVKSQSQNLFFDLVSSKNPFPEKFSPDSSGVKVGDVIEVSHESLMQVDIMSKMINSCGGCILNIDYGSQGYFDDSIRAIKDHKYIPSPYFWQVPGLCDLSAYVNFQALKTFAERNKGIKAFEAVPQGFFLQAMGIIPRIDLLKKNMKEQDQNRLESQYNRLVLPNQMGEIYKVQLITKEEYGQIYPLIEEDEHSF